MSAFVKIMWSPLSRARTKPFVFQDTHKFAVVDWRDARHAVFLGGNGTASRTLAVNDRAAAILRPRFRKPRFK